MADIIVLVGTTKGAFLLTSQDDRSGWTLSGPHCEGWTINHVSGDPETGLLAAGGGSDWSGAGVFVSRDGGVTWDLTKLTKGQMDEWAANDPGFAAMIGWEDKPAPFEGLKAVWSVKFAHGALYAGTNPAQLLVSRDGGAQFEMVEGISQHPTRDTWNPGAAGMVLHTIVPDPDVQEKMWIGSRLPVCSQPRMAARPGSGATDCRMLKPVRIITTRRRRRMARSGIACTTWFGLVAAICCINRTTTGSGDHVMVAAIGTTSPKGCRLPLAFPWPYIRMIRKRFGLCL